MCFAKLHLLYTQHINNKRKMEQIEMEFIKHSMNRLKLPISTDDARRAMSSFFFRGLNLCPSSDAAEKNVWEVDREGMNVQMPEHFERYMTELADIFSNEGTKPSSIRPRTDWVVVVMTAIVRRNKDQLYPNSSPPSHHAHKAPRWNLKTTLAGSDLAMKAPVDYVLWYGPRGDWDTNLVVVRSSSRLEGECWAALLSTSAVYAARKAKKFKGGVYGICTDSYFWTFLHLSDKGHVSKRCLSWEDNKQEVIGQLYKIIGQAFDLHRAREEDPEGQKRMRDEYFCRWDRDEESSGDDASVNSDAHPWV
ncbi:hypothetical protein BJX96DRAFT_132576 [Aspergillus floccosus]